MWVQRLDVGAKVVTLTDVASLRPNSVSAETATVIGTRETLRIRLRASASTRGRIASNAAHRGERQKGASEGQMG